MEGRVLRKLVVYFSGFGNTEKVAARVAERTGADVCRIEPFEPYPDNLQEVMKIGRRETDGGVVRSIREPGVDFSGCDEVILGMPTWWCHMPPCISCLLKSVHFERVHVFVTDSGLPFDIVEEMRRVSPGTQVESSIAVEFTPLVEPPSRLVTPVEEIDAWIDSL